MAARKWYHGTSTEAGLDLDDYLDPHYATFESFVWATSSLQHARFFAMSRAAVDGGKPVVFAVCIADRAIVNELVDYDEQAVEQMQEDGVDAVVVRRGETGTPDLAILSRSGVFVCGVAA